MNTIVFHSYKGGVGRTLTLANLGYALSRMGKKVVLLDLDVDAPSLPSKFEQENNVRGGYIDYLKQYYEPIEDKTRAKTVIYEVMDASIEERSRSLQKYTLDVNPNLKLIPAGDPARPAYWWNLGSTWLHFLLSLTRDEITKVENGNPIHNTVSREFLRRERDVIKALFGRGGADYLIVDCRSPREYSSVALVFWADIVVSMFNASTDGVNGLINIHHFVRRARSEDSKPGEIVRPRIVPVLSRVPEDFSADNAKQLEDGIKARWEEVQMSFARALEPPEPFVTLHEFRDLEQTERLLLRRQAKPAKRTPAIVRDIEATLSHDYVGLFSRIFTCEKDVARGSLLRDERIWSRALGLSKTAITRERFFPIRRNGVMFNVDNERNVAVRAKSVLSWLKSFKDDMEAGLRKRAPVKRTNIARDVNTMFARAGYNWGLDFGRDKLMQPQSASTTVPVDVADLLSNWCKFDHQAGFGSIKYVYTASSATGKIIWKDSFLEEAGKRHSYLIHFACGYIRGVLENLLPNAKGGVSVRPISTTGFEFKVRSFAKNRKQQRRKRQPKQS